MKDKGQGFFDIPEGWEDEWQGMPEFVQEDKTPFKTVYVHFETQEDVEAFAKLVEQRIGSKTKFIWYPKVTPEKLINKLYVDEDKQK